MGVSPLVSPTHHLQMVVEDKIIRWQKSLRPLDPGVEDKSKKPKPKWSGSSVNSRMEQLGGSLWTARKIQPRPPRPATPPREPTPPPPSPPPEPLPAPIPWRDKYQFEPLGPTLGRSNIIESAIKQIQDENILSIGHYPKDGVVKDNFADMRSESRMSNRTFTINSNDNYSALDSLRSRSRSKSPGVFSKSTVASRQKQRESVDYMFGQYAFTTDLPPPPTPQPRPQPDWERRPSQTCSEDSKMSSFRSFGSSSGSEGNGRKSSFKKSATKLNGPFPLWLEDDSDSKPERGY